MQDLYTIGCEYADLLVVDVNYIQVPVFFQFMQKGNIVRFTSYDCLQKILVPLN